VVVVANVSLKSTVCRGEGGVPAERGFLALICLVCIRDQLVEWVEVLLYMGEVARDEIDLADESTQCSDSGWDGLGNDRLNVGGGVGNVVVRDGVSQELSLGSDKLTLFHG
jgi:hypothetical protein